VNIAAGEEGGKKERALALQVTGWREVRKKGRNFYIGNSWRSGRGGEFVNGAKGRSAAGRCGK